VLRASSSLYAKHDDSASTLGTTNLDDTAEWAPFPTLDLLPATRRPDRASPWRTGRCDPVLAVVAERCWAWEGSEGACCGGPCLARASPLVTSWVREWFLVVVSRLAAR